MEALPRTPSVPLVRQQKIVPVSTARSMPPRRAAVVLIPLLMFGVQSVFSTAAERPVEVGHVWSTVWPYYSTESAFRCLDVNGDGVDDVIVGFATGKSRTNLSTSEARLSNSFMLKFCLREYVFV